MVEGELAMLYADLPWLLGPRSIHGVAHRPTRADVLWVARWVAGQRESRFMRRNVLIPKDFLAVHPQYDIVLM